jgi:hypothetical protein
MGRRIDERGGGSSLLQLLHFAGWRVEVEDGPEATIRAVRDGVRVEARAPTFPEASGIVFARAMRSRAKTGSRAA